MSKLAAAAIGLATLVASSVVACNVYELVTERENRRFQTAYATLQRQPEISASLPEGSLMSYFSDKGIYLQTPEGKAVLFDLETRCPQLILDHKAKPNAYSPRDVPIPLHKAGFCKMADYKVLTEGAK